MEQKKNEGEGVTRKREGKEVNALHVYGEEWE